MMAIAHSKLTDQGQISVPAEIRRKLGLAPGSVVEWHEFGEQIVVRRATRFTSKDIHQALFEQSPKPRSLDDLKSGIKRHMRKRHARR